MEDSTRDNRSPLDYADYVRNSKQTQRTIHLSDIVYRAIIEGIARSDLLRCNILDPSERRQGWDVYRMIRSDIEIINVRVKELFSSFTVKLYKASFLSRHHFCPASYS